MGSEKAFSVELDLTDGIPTPTGTLTKTDKEILEAIKTACSAGYVVTIRLKEF